MCGVALNAFLNWILIFGNLGAPAMGLEGAGVATLISRIAVMLGVIGYPASSPSLRAFWPKRWLAPGIIPAARKILSVGLPAGAMTLSEVSGFAFGSIMMGWIGVGPLAAHQIAMTCAATVFMVPLGLSQAVSVRVGQAQGAGRFETLRPIIFGALALSILIMSTSLCAFVFCGNSIASWFIDDLEVRRITAQLLFMGGIYQIFDGIQVVSAGALRGFKDTTIPMWLGVLSYWLVGLPVSWTAAFFFGGGARGIWLGFVVGLAFASSSLLLRVRWRMAQIPDAAMRKV